MMMEHHGRHHGEHHEGHHGGHHEGHHNQELTPLDVPSLPPPVNVMNEDPQILSSYELGDYSYSAPEGKSGEYPTEPKIDENDPSAPEYKDDE
jgi:hypothetical protein